MEVEHFSTEELSPEEIKQLEELKRIIEAAVSDGILSHSELEHIKNVAFAHKKILPAELQLYSKLVLEKSSEENWSMGGERWISVADNLRMSVVLKLP